MGRLADAMAALKSGGRRAFVPFLSSGDPSLARTRELWHALDRAGADLIEVGIPFSDPLADGPTIQTSFTRALQCGIRVREILAMVSRLRQRCDLPLLAMLSYSIVHRIGPTTFLGLACDAGLDGLILPDLSLEEAPEISRLAAGAGLRLPMLVSPASTPDRRQRIAATCTGFVYYMSVTGITGERDQLPPELVTNVHQLREASGKPVVVGFGISTAEHVRLVCSEADGAIIGSALVRRMMEAQDAGGNADAIVTATTDAVREWMTGLP